MTTVSVKSAIRIGSSFLTFCRRTLRKFPAFNGENLYPKHKFDLCPPYISTISEVPANSAHFGAHIGRRRHQGARAAETTRDVLNDANLSSFTKLRVGSTTPTFRRLRNHGPAIPRMRLYLIFVQYEHQNGQSWLDLLNYLRYTEDKGFAMGGVNQIFTLPTGLTSLQTIYWFSGYTFAIFWSSCNIIVKRQYRLYTSRAPYIP